MTEQYERAIKEKVAELDKLQSCTMGMANEANQAYRPPSLLDNINKQLSYAQQEARKCDKLQELKFLLEKNPEIARILDLIEETRR